jgi:two-component system response regulator HydG
VVPDDKIRVLIVDDEPEVAAVLEEMVAGFGHQTSVAHNGVQAIRAVREFAPQVVLLDIRMPGIDGHTVLDHLRGSAQPPSIIIVSGNHQEEEARQLLQRGAFDYVTKPVDFNYLQQAIAAAADAAPQSD